MLQRMARCVCLAARLVLGSLCCGCGPNIEAVNGETSAGTTETGTSDTSGGSSATSMATFVEPDGTCSGVVCPEGEFCVWQQGSCGRLASDVGACVAPAEACTLEWDDVCGCDGNLQGSVCQAASVGVDIDRLNQCETPRGMFRCGHRFCNLGQTYCQHMVADEDGVFDAHWCGLEWQCEPLDCPCLIAEVCPGGTCQPTEDGGVIITCPS